MSVKPDHRVFPAAASAPSHPTDPRARIVAALRWRGSADPAPAAAPELVTHPRYIP